MNAHTRMTARSGPAVPGADFTPPDIAARLYPGKVMHARLKPFGHRFNYRVFSLLIDLDRLDEAGRMSALFSVNRANIMSFHERDHLPKTSSDYGIADEPGTEFGSLRAYIDDLVRRAGAPAPARVLLLAYPRIAGFVFNPLSVYFCFGADGQLTTAIYEVRNTFGERHTYVCAVEPGQLNAAGLRQERTKIFYVSPFIDLGMRYLFRVQPPGDTVKIRILETDDGAPLLSATFAGQARPLDTPNLAGQLARLPFMTLKVVAGIHWEALKLWIKGAKFHSRGVPPGPVSVKDTATEPAE